MLKICQFVFRWQFSPDQQIGSFQKRALFGQLLDADPSVFQQSFLSINVADA
ncbi:hypothetical protein NIES39_E02880 [Arthrospira platensis NIES-39]|nr:hypothetical protein NIES39_E02880 [Arthrospira platensis NIES-39]